MVVTALPLGNSGAVSAVDDDVVPDVDGRAEQAPLPVPDVGYLAADIARGQQDELSVSLLMADPVACLDRLGGVGDLSSQRRSSD